MEKQVCPFGGPFKCENLDCSEWNSLRDVLKKCIEIVKKISYGDTSERIELKTESPIINELIDSINFLSKEIDSLIDLNHQLAVGICEHFEVLRRLQKGDFTAKASTDSPIEIVSMLGELINKQRDRFLDYLNKLKEQNQDIVQLYLQQNSILSSVGVAIIVIEDDMTIEFANREFEELTGYTKQEIEGKLKWTEFFAEEMLERMMEYHRLRRVNPDLAPRQYETKLKDKKGNIKDVLLNVGMIPYTNKSIASIMDISERKKIAEQLMHSQKIEALGILSGRVAHEFNNILAGILGFAGILNMQLKDEKLKGHVQKIIASGERAKELVGKLLTFSRKEVGNVQKVELRKFFNEFSDFIRQIIGKDIELNLILPEDEIIYDIDPTHLEIILMNFVTNARDAMPRGGKLTIALEVKNIDIDYHYTHPLIKPGYYIVISITDTGIGMDEKTKERIFEPFFTTKPKGKGTGLGLSTVYGLVKNYDGQINVYSELNKGTTFRIYFPYTKKREFSEVEIESVRGKETLLIVDDDARVRDYLKTFLQEYGYNVYEAKGAEEALSIFDQMKEKIDLYLIDLVMPDTSGIELAKRIRNQAPDSKIIIMSGHRVDLKIFPSVEKTLSPIEILLTIRKILDNKE